MDDTAQNQANTPVANTPVQQPAPQVPAPQPVQNQPPVQPVGHHPEHAPGIAAAPVVEAPMSGPDTISDAADVADSQQAPDVVIKESQPELPQELKEIGIEQGEDAKQDRPEEQQKVDVALPKEQSHELPVVGAKPLPMDYQQAVATQKTSKIRDSIKWFATLIKYQWEQIQVKGEKTDAA